MLMTDQETEATSRPDPQVRAGQAQGPSLLLPWPVRTGTVEDMAARWPVQLKSAPPPPQLTLVTGWPVRPGTPPGTASLGAAQGQEPRKRYLSVLLCLLCRPHFPHLSMTSSLPQTTETVKCGTLPRRLEDLGRSHPWEWWP